MKKYISYNKTAIKLNNKNIIFKKYVIKTIPKQKHSLINKSILSYHNTLFKNCKAIPKLISNKKNLEFYFEYCGKSLSEILKNPKLKKREMKEILKGIVEILNICEKKKIGMDPHFKNFTLKKKKIYFVDIYPPIRKDFISLLIKHNKKIKFRILKHLENYNHNKIKQHFLADLKKTSYINKNFYKYAVEYFMVNNVVSKINYKLINQIIKTEESNLNNKLFTLS